MEAGDMGNRWNHYRFQLGKVSLVLLIFLLMQTRECLSINLEGGALLKFRSKVDVDPYGALKNWNRSDYAPCNWTGVQCVDGKVVSLNLKDLSLGGVLAPELGKLQNLKFLVLYKNNFSGGIPNEFERLTSLELLDLRCNKLRGAIPAKIGEIRSLKHLLLCDNMFQGPAPSFKNLDMVLDSKCEWHHSPDMAINIVQLNRKSGHWIKVKISSADDSSDNHEISLPSFLAPCKVINRQNSMNFNRRKLLQETSNLPATPVTNSLPRGLAPVPSTGSGSFLAVPKTVSMDLRGHSSVPKFPKYFLPSLIATDKPFVLDPPGHINNEIITSEKPGNWVYIISLLATLLACAAIISSIVRHRQGGAAIAPWKTGLSGQLRRALISGVTKLKRLELEVACEDFSNIVNTYPECIVFKGTLSSGIEIAVVSTVITSSRDWSRRTELRFRDKIDALSKINHKNFVNLLGYCSEDNSFMRMLAYEYAPNGSLFEHIHLKEFEHLDWASRMRIVMGVAYCLQFMHHELHPPFTVPELQSNSIYLTDDYAAKICDTSVWKEITAKRSKSADHDFDPSESPDICLWSNVYSFGVLLLEIISGKLPYSEEHGSIVHWATEFLNDKHNIKCLVDRSLKSFKYNELEAICEVIQDCIHQYPENRPTMKEVAARLGEALGITPDVASPRLSPLWWAELEILSVEAN